MLLGLLLLLGILVVPFGLSAQSDEQLYYPYAGYREELDLPLLKSDTTLFYRATLGDQELYGELTRYSFSEVAAFRRGITYREERNLIDGLEVGYRNFSILRSLGLMASNVRVGEESLASFTDPRPAEHRLRAHLGESRYRFGLSYLGHLDPGRGWQLDLYLDGRIGRDAHTLGVYTRQLRTALHLEKRWTESLRFSLSAAVAPSERAAGSSTTEEVFRLVGDPYYNPAWGFYRGEVRSDRIRRELLPLLTTSLHLPITPSTTLQISALAEFGLHSLSSIGWYDAATPRPDHYRNLPSYFTDPLRAEQVADYWRSHDSRYTQIDWEELCAQNRISREGARYIVQDDVEEPIDLKGRLLFTTRPSEGLLLRYGAEAAYCHTRHYLRVRDLLEADYLHDIDYYLLDDDSYASKLENDLRNPDRRVGEGDRFGHHYAMVRRRFSALFGAEYRAGRWSLDLQGEVALQRLHREGFYEKELFPREGSLGPSRRLDFSPYRLAGRFAYAFTPRMHLTLHLDARSEMPEADHLFLQPQYNNRTIDRPVSEHLLHLELGFRRRSESLEWSAVAFLHRVDNAIRTGRYYDDLSGLFTDRVVEQIDEQTYGLELAARYYPAERWRLSAAFSLQRARYTDNPLVSLYSDRDNLLLLDRSESMMTSCRPGAVPQLMGLLSAAHLARSWGAACDLTYAGMRYAHPDFMRRTVRVALQAADSPEAFDAFVAQERLDDLFRLDLSLWKHFRLGRDARLTLSLRVENLLGDDSTPYDSYESARLSRQRIADGYTYRPFDNRLSYAPPRTFSLSATVRFW